MTNEEDAYPGFPRTGEFRTILADVPWPYRQKLKGNRMRNQLPYETMTEEQIFSLPIGEAAAKDAVLLFWTTNSHLELAIECVRHYGFETKTVLTWGKITHDRRPRPGTGFWLRGATEHALLAVKGKPASVQTRSVRGERIPMHATLLLAPPGAHSEKPSESYVILEDIGYAPRLELFARRHRAGWSTWGNHPIRGVDGSLQGLLSTGATP